MRALLAVAKKRKLHGLAHGGEPVSADVASRSRSRTERRASGSAARPAHRPAGHRGPGVSSSWSPIPQKPRQPLSTSRSGGRGFRMPSQPPGGLRRPVPSTGTKTRREALAEDEDLSPGARRSWAVGWVRSTPADRRGARGTRARHRRRTHDDRHRDDSRRPTDALQARAVPGPPPWTRSRACRTRCARPRPTWPRDARNGRSSSSSPTAPSPTSRPARPWA